MKIVIVTTTHWEGDPRLRRHLRYLGDGGFETELEVATSGSKLVSLLRGLNRIIRSDADVVLLPDPELFVLGALAARLSRKRPVLDIHEDYPKAAAERPWVPAPLRPLVRVLATLSVSLGRILAARVMVAAQFLAKPGDSVVVNVPDPSDFRPEPAAKSQVVYVGEVTLARGAVDMVEVLARLPSDLALVVIGRIGEATRDLMMVRAAQLGVEDRLQMPGRMSHDRAWAEAAGSVAGLTLLRSAPAYLDAVATKLWEYMAAGLAPVVSDLPGQGGVVAGIHPDLVCANLEEAAAAITRLVTEPGFRSEAVAKGRALVQSEWARTRPDLAIQEAVAP